MFQPAIATSLRDQSGLVALELAEDVPGVRPGEGGWPVLLVGGTGRSSSGATWASRPRRGAAVTAMIGASAATLKPDGDSANGPVPKPTMDQVPAIVPSPS